MTFTTGSPSPSEIAMENFMHQWKNGKMELYQRLAEAARDVCKAALEPKGLPGLVVSSRAKDPGSLQAKFEKYKHKDKIFETPEEIEKAMVDLAGARIIMDNERDLAHAGDVIREHADEVKVVEHPPSTGPIKENTFLYEATHWRVRLTRKALLECGVGDACGKWVEIQVRTTAMDILAEREHDVLYKSYQHPKLRDQQYFTLNGLLRKVSDTVEVQWSESVEQKAAKNNECLEELNTIGYRVQKWIKDSKEGWFKDKEVKEFKPLWMYLRCERGMNSRAGLYQILETYLRPAKLESTYAEVSSQYMCDNLNLVVFIMDQVHLGGNQNQYSAELGHERKIEIIKSTMVWLDRISVSKLTWQCNFTHDRSRETLRDSLAWLQRFRPKRVQGHSSLGPDEVKKLNWLWQWFEQHQTRPIRLAFAIAKHGEPRRSRESRDIITPLIANLGVSIYS